jgi:hypothetical protein
VRTSHPPGLHKTFPFLFETDFSTQPPIREASHGCF